MSMKPAESEKRLEHVTFPIVFSLKVNWDLRKNIEKIALFEKKKPATWARDILVEKIQVYERRPDYLKFKRQFEGLKSE
jgi:hypothetical protein